MLQRNAVREATAFLLDALQDDKPEHAMLQTKVQRVAINNQLATAPPWHGVMAAALVSKQSVGTCDLALLHAQREIHTTRASVPYAID